MDERIRRLERSLRVDGYDEGVFDAYMAAMARSDIKMCHCENSLCEKVHVYDPRYGPAPGEVRIDDESVNVGFCINPADPKVHVEYVQMCDECAQQLPKDWHLPECDCTLCHKESPQDIVANMLDDDGDPIDEPDPTIEGWYEDWESDEFDD
jgi:hypothetical protein